MKKRQLCVLFVLVLTLTLSSTLLFSASSLAARTYACYYAEGNTRAGYTEYVTIANPNSAAISVRVNYIYDGRPHTRDYAVASLARRTITVASEVPPEKDVALAITSGSPFVAERPIYFDAAGYRGLNNSPRITEARKRFCFAEGNTRAGTTEWLCLVNPSQAATRAHVRMVFDGGNVREATVNLPRWSRRTLKVGDYVPSGQDVSCLIDSDRPIACERVQYFDFRGFNGGHISSGQAELLTPGQGLDFAEGTKSSGYEEYICLANPTPSSASARVTYRSSDGSSATRNYEVGPNTRFTMNLADVAGIAGPDVSARVVSTRGALMAERAMYFNTGAITGGHVGSGETTGATRRAYYFAEGCTRSGFTEYVCIANVSNRAASVRLDFLTGAASTTRYDLSVPAGSRRTVNVHQILPRETEHGTMLSSDQNIVAETATYCSRAEWNGGDVSSGLSGDITHIGLSPRSAHLLEGQQLAFAASLWTEDSYPVERDFAWRTSGGVGTISAAGLFSATHAGQGRVTARTMGLEARADVFVRSNPNRLTASIEDPTEAELVGGPASDGQVPIMGTADGADFDRFTLHVYPIDHPERVTLIASSRVSHPTLWPLGTWDASRASGDYTILLTVTGKRQGSPLMVYRNVSVLPCPPDLTAAISSPEPGEVSAKVPVTMSVGGSELTRWTLSYESEDPEAHPSGVIAEGAFPETGTYQWPTLALPLGSYRLVLTAEADWGEPLMATVEGLEVVPDLEAALQVASPCSGQVEICGTAAGADFSSYRVDYIEKSSGQVTSSPVSAERKCAGVLDTWDATLLQGDYTVRLVVSSERQGVHYELTAQADVTVDATAPDLEVRIDEPTGGQRLEGGVEVIGAAAGDDLASWSLEYASAEIEPRAWIPLASGQGPASGLLAAWDTTLLPNGLYDLRISASAVWGAPATTLVRGLLIDNRHLDHIEIVPESLTLEHDEAATVRVMGFDQEGDPFDIGPAEVSLADTAPGQGATSVGELAETGTLNERVFSGTGWGSATICAVVGPLSARCPVTVNPPPPNDLTAVIAQPLAGSVEGQVQVRGTASGTGFRYYALEWAPAGTQDWSEISTSSEPVTDGSLGTWDTTLLPDGDCVLRLRVVPHHWDAEIVEVALEVDNVHEHQLARIEISPGAQMVWHTGTQAFSALGYDQDGNQMNVSPSWSLEDPDVGSVDATGLFTASGFGSCHLVAESEGITARAWVQVPSILSGTQNTDVTLRKKNNPYLLISTYAIPEGVTLTMEAGVVVKSMNCDNWGLCQMAVSGTVLCNGTAAEPVFFTSYKDDTVWGDTDNYPESVPAAGDWGALYFDSPTSVLRHMVVKYYGTVEVKGANTFSDCSFSHSQHNCVHCAAGSPVLERCRMESGGINGVLVSGGSALITDCDSEHGAWIEDCAQAGVAVASGAPEVLNNDIARCASGVSATEPSAYATPTIRDNKITGCVGPAMSLWGFNAFDVRGNSGRANGTNGILVNGVYHQPETVWSHNPTLPWVMDYGNADRGNSIEISPGAKLIIEKGTVVKCKGNASDDNMTVKGTLESRGEPSDRVTFTSVKADDVDGVDTNGDGPSTGSPGDWGTFYIYAQSAPEQQNTVNLRSTDMVYMSSTIIGSGPNTFSDCGFSNTTGVGLLLTDADGTLVEDCHISNAVAGIHVAGSGNPTVRGCDIKDIQGNPDWGQGCGIRVEAGSPVITGNTIEDCQKDGIRIEACAAGSVLANNTVNRCGGFLAHVRANLENVDIYGNAGTGCRINGIEVGSTAPLAASRLFKRNQVPYTLTTAGLTVPAGKALTMENSTVFKAKHNGITISPAACLSMADGTVFTSIWDESGAGDTVNMAEIDKNPDWGDWNGITAQEGSSVDLGAATLSYGQTLLSLADGVSLGDVSNLHIVNGNFDKSMGTHLRAGGTGIHFQGESNTTIHDCLLEWCDKAVLISEKAPHSGEVYPALSANNRLWSDTYGIYVDGVVSEEHAAIDARNNDWCDDRVYDYENGPEPAGSGSNIGASGMSDSSVRLVRTINWFPYSGLPQPYYKTDVRDRDWNHPTVGLYMNADFNGAEMESMASVFRSSGDDCKVKTYLWGTDEVDPAQLQNAATGGQDDEFVNTNNLAWVNSHGAIRRHGEGIAGVVCYGDYDFFADDDSPDLFCDGDNIRWGTGHLDWIAIDACRFMAKNTQVDARYGGPTGHDGIEGIDAPRFDDGDDYFASKMDLDARYRRQTIDNGLHMLLGFANTANTGGTDQNCSEFARLATGQNGEQKSIIGAFFTANAKYQCYDFRWNDYDLTTVEGQKGAAWGPLGSYGSAVEWGAVSVVYSATENLPDRFAEEASMRRCPGERSTTAMLKRSSDVPFDDTGKGPGVGVSYGPPRELLILDENGNRLTEIDATSPTRLRVKAKVVVEEDGTWPSSIPGILDDMLFGSRRGIFIEIQKVDGLFGFPTGDSTLVINCNDTCVEGVVRESNTSGIMQIPKLDVLQPGDKFKMRVYNARTWYWGNADSIISVRPPDETP